MRFGISLEIRVIDIVRTSIYFSSCSVNFRLTESQYTLLMRNCPIFLGYERLSGSSPISYVRIIREIHDLTWEE